MADNYLEKKMEEFKAGKVGVGSGAAASPSLKFHGVEVLLAHLEPAVAAAIARTLKLTGARLLATADCGFKPGAGVRIYPDGVDIAADVAARRERITHVITAEPEGVSTPDARVTIPDARITTPDARISIPDARIIALADTAVPGAVTLSGGTPASLAAIILGIVHPASALPPQIIKVGAE